MDEVEARGKKPEGRNRCKKLEARNKEQEVRSRNGRDSWKIQEKGNRCRKSKSKTT